MRQIKFRAWDRCNERMVEPRNILKIHMSRLNQEPYLIVYLKKWLNPHKEIKEIDKCYTNEFELMQYTGLKDRNGVEIYDGDIVACGDGKVPTEIRWVQESSAFMAYNPKRKEYHLLNKSFEIFIGEIIGNIHEEVQE